MRVLITAGPTREPVDAVRYLSNRSSGKMGAALATSAVRGHDVTLIVGPVSTAMPLGISRINVETSGQMQTAVAREFPNHDVLIMAAAVADYRPMQVQPGKLGRSGPMALELEPTEDIIAAASRGKRADQRTVAFSLEAGGDVERARGKMLRKGVDLMVYNSAATMSSETVEAILLYPDGRLEHLPCRGKDEFADILMERVAALL